MSDDDLKDRTTEFMHILAASEADVANISADRTKRGMCVTFDLLEPDDADLDLVQDIATEHSFEQYGDTGERFEAES